MANIAINDLPVNQALDRWAMAQIRGANGAPWVFGWIQPFVGGQANQPSVVNFFQINNFADQMINQFQSVSVSNTAPNANLNVNVGESSVNNRH